MTRRLEDLILVAEQQGRKEAQQGARLAEDSSQAIQEGRSEPKGIDESVNEQLNLDALYRDVLYSVENAMNLRKTLKNRAGIVTEEITSQQFVDMVNDEFDLETLELMKQNLDFDLLKSENKYKIIKSDLIYNKWEDWMREVIWYGHRSGKYVCDIISLNENSKSSINENDRSNIIGNSYIV